MRNHVQKNEIDRQTEFKRIWECLVICLDTHACMSKNRWTKWIMKKVMKMGVDRLRKMGELERAMGMWSCVIICM